MTKEMYFEMCESMGSEIEEDQIPPDIEDLTNQSQEVINMFNYLPDIWNSFAGVYEGKNLSNIKFVLELFEVDKTDWLLYMELLSIVINEKISSTNSKLRAKNSGKINTKRVQNTS